MPRHTPPDKSLLVLFPLIAAQADGWNPSRFPAHSHQKMTWKCGAGHKWETAIYNRTSGKRGCPYCSGRFPIIGVNDLQTKNPSLAAEACGCGIHRDSAQAGATDGLEAALIQSAHFRLSTRFGTVTNKNQARINKPYIV